MGYVPGFPGAHTQAETLDGLDQNPRAVSELLLEGEEPRLDAEFVGTHTVSIAVCGWCRDRWGLSCQITPVALIKAVADPDLAAAERAFDAMMQMTKIDVATIEAAHRG